MFKVGDKIIVNENGSKYNITKPGSKGAIIAIDGAIVTIDFDLLTGDYSSQKDWAISKETIDLDPVELTKLAEVLR